MIKHFAKKDDQRAMLRWVDMMSKDEIHKPDERTFRIILGYYARKNDMENARK